MKRTSRHAASSGCSARTRALTSWKRPRPIHSSPSSACAGQPAVNHAGASIAAYALYQWYRAAAKDVNKRLDLSQADPRVALWVERLARFGIAARGVVFAIIGWLLIHAGLRFDPNQAGGVRESLITLRQQPYGAAVLGVIAAGLVAYGLFQFANARYRRVRVA